MSSTVTRLRQWRATAKELLSADESTRSSARDAAYKKAGTALAYTVNTWVPGGGALVKAVGEERAVKIVVWTAALIFGVLSTFMVLVLMASSSVANSSSVIASLFGGSSLTSPDGRSDYSEFDNTTLGLCVSQPTVSNRPSSAPQAASPSGSPYSSGAAGRSGAAAPSKLPGTDVGVREVNDAAKQIPRGATLTEARGWLLWTLAHPGGGRLGTWSAFSRAFAGTRSDTSAESRVSELDKGADYGPFLMVAAAKAYVLAQEGTVTASDEEINEMGSSMYTYCQSGVAGR